jgi:hypothetical protein
MLTGNPIRISGVGREMCDECWNLEAASEPPSRDYRPSRPMAIPAKE